MVGGLELGYLECLSQLKPFYGFRNYDEEGI